MCSTKNKRTMGYCSSQKYTFLSLLSQILTRYRQIYQLTKNELFFKYFCTNFFRLLETNNTNLGTQNKQNLLVFVQTHKNIIIYFLTIFFFVVYLGLVPVRKFILKYNSIFVCSVLLFANCSISSIHRNFVQK